MLSGQHVSALPRCQRQRVTVLLAASVSLALALILVVSSLHRGSSVLVANVGVVSEGRSASPLRKYVSEGSDVRVFPVDSPASAELPAAAPLQALLQAEGRHAIAESLAALAFYEKCPLNHADYKYDAALFHPIIRRSLANWRAAGLTNRSIDTVWMTRTSNLHAPLWYSVRRGVVYQRVHPSVEEEPVYHGHVMDLIRAAAGLKPTPPDSELVVSFCCRWTMLSQLLSSIRAFTNAAYVRAASCSHSLTTCVSCRPRCDSDCSSIRGIIPKCRSKICCPSSRG